MTRPVRHQSGSQEFLTPGPHTTHRAGPQWAVHAKLTPSRYHHAIPVFVRFTSTPSAAHAPSSPARRVPRLRTRGRANACQARANPRSADLRHNRLASAPNGGMSSATTKHRQGPALRHPALTGPDPAVSTAGSRRPPGLLPVEQKASQSLPALQAPVSNGAAIAPEVVAPRSFPCSEPAPAYYQQACWALLKRAGPDRTLRAAPDVAHRSRQPLSTAFHASHGRVGLHEPPRATPLINSTPLWTFGQGRTHASGWRCTPELIHQTGARPDLDADALHALERGRHLHCPWLQKCTDGLGSPRFTFKADRVDRTHPPVGCAGRQNLRVGAARMGSRAVPTNQIPCRGSFGVGCWPAACTVPC